MSETFTFKPHPSIGEIVHKIESPKGQKAIGQILADFSSLADVISHTHAVGNDTVIDLPHHQTITLVNLPEKEIRAEAKQIAHVLFG